MRYGVIDLGTNTFHLMVVENQLPLKRVYKENHFVKLASEGITNIGEAPYQRALSALHKFKLAIEKHDIQELRALGTAALRTAKNGPDLVRQVLEETGIPIELISGEEEARLIHQGVIQAIPMSDEDRLIIDIGGGSVEFIITNQGVLKWAKSFPIGVAVLHKAFHKNDPITKDEIDSLHQYLEEILSPLIEEIKKYDIQSIVGASGTFDVLEIFLSEGFKFKHHAMITAKDFKQFHQDLRFSSLQERYDMEKLPNTRIDLIVMALELIGFVVDKTSAKVLITSAYAMKEGALFEMIEGK